VGKASAHLAVFEAVAKLQAAFPPKKCKDDQALIAWVMLQQLAPVTADYQRSLFQSMYELKSTDYAFDSSTGLWTFPGANASIYSPWVLHFNGDKDLVVPTAKKLTEWHLSHSADVQEAMAYAPVWVDGVATTFGLLCDGRMKRTWWEWWHREHPPHGWVVGDK
jgi:hypothetical protein